MGDTVLGGVTFTDAGWANRGHLDTIVVDGQSYPRWQGLWVAGQNQVATDITGVGSALYATSSTSAAIGTGSKSLTIETGKGFAAGNIVIASENGDTSNFMLGTVTSYDTDTGALAFTVASGDTGGSGTIADWVVSISGPRGAAGADGDLSGPVSSTDNAWPRWNGTGGETLQDGDWVEDDSGNVTAGGALDMDGNTFTAGPIVIEGTVSGGDNEVNRVELKDYSETRVSANTTSTYTVDLENGNVLDLTLTDNCTFTFSNPPSSGRSGSFTMILSQTDGSPSGFTAIWPGAVQWAGGEAPTLTSDAGATDIFTFMTVDGGTTWYGFTAGQDFS